MEHLNRVHDWSALNVELGVQLPALVPMFLGDLGEPDARVVERTVTSGKKIRACLVLAVCDALGASISRAMRSAIAVECVHAASLIHDDLVDGDPTRRSEPAAWIVHGSRRAVLLGDVIFATALYRAAQIGKDEVLTLSRAIAQVAAGAYQERIDPRDIEQAVSDGSFGPVLYERVIQLKTGALFAAAAELGAIAAGASSELRHASAEFGARTGRAYQIADDLEDVLGYIGASAITRQQRALLASFLASFDMAEAAQAALAPGEPLHCLADLRDLVGAMEAEIARQTTLAQRALTEFPQRSRVDLLHAIPSMIVEPSLRAARCVRRDVACNDLRAFGP